MCFGLVEIPICAIFKSMLVGHVPGSRFFTWKDCISFMAFLYFAGIHLLRIDLGGLKPVVTIWIFLNKQPSIPTILGYLQVTSPQSHLFTR